MNPLLPISDHSYRLERDGFTNLPSIIGDEWRAQLIQSLHQAAADEHRPRGQFARRDLLKNPVVWELALSAELREIIEPVLGPAARPVRGLLFDKIPSANWIVPWHQDRSIAVRQRLDVPGFGPWSVKEGVPHVQPPEGILRNMVTVRLHLDECDESNGPLCAIPGTHHRILSLDEIARLTQAGTRATCTAHIGDALVMRPLLLHGSFPAKRPSHRRVIHLEYAGAELPCGLEWHAQYNSTPVV